LNLDTTLFYKFQEITNLASLNQDYSLDALFKSYAVFSGRKNYNDLFDSKIDLVHPTLQQVLSLLRARIDPTKRRIMDGWVSKGRFTPAGVTFLKTIETKFGELIDTYPIYSVSIHCTCNLLWAHYASSHKGFCIEFAFDENEQPQKVIYQEHIECINLIDFLRYDLGLDNSNELGVRIHNALLVKLEEWRYEGEHRWIASNSMGRVPTGEKFIKIKYEPRKVKSIIFGCRMTPDVKKHIIKNIPFTTRFKQALEMKDRVEIVDFDDKKHL
jgi:hypothetical protein